MNRSTRATAALTGAVACLTLAPVASAHVTLQPEQAPAGGFARLDVRVPNERDDAATTQVRVQFPDGFAFVSYEPVPGWEVEVRRERLDEPIEAFGEQIREQVDEVVMTAEEGQGIRPGQFRDFGLSVGLPDQAGAALTFPSLQRYEGGETVRWIGPPDSDEPAPQVRLVAETDPAAAQAPTSGPATGEAAAGGAAGGDDGGPSTGLVIAALVAGALGLALGLAGLVSARRARTGSA